MNRNLRCCMAIGLLLVLGGCGGDTPDGLAPAEGTVKMGDAPVAGALVTFYGGSYMAMGTTDETGKFVMYTREHAGLTPGTYKVTVTKKAKSAASTVTVPTDASQMKVELTRPDASNPTGSGPVVEAKNDLNAKYAEQNTTPLSFTVDKDGSKNKFAITLEP